MLDETERPPSPEELGIKYYSPVEARGWAIREVPEIFRESKTSELLRLIQSESDSGRVLVDNALGRYSEENHGYTPIPEEIDTPDILKDLFTDESVELTNSSSGIVLQQRKGVDNRRLKVMLNENGEVAAIDYKFGSTIGNDTAWMQMELIFDSEHFYPQGGNKPKYMRSNIGMDRFWIPGNGTIFKRMEIERRGKVKRYKELLGGAPRYEGDKVKKWRVDWMVHDGEQQVIRVNSGEHDLNSTEVVRELRDDADFLKGSSFVADQLLTAMPGLSQEDLSKASEVMIHLRTDKK